MYHCFIKIYIVNTILVIILISIYQHLYELCFAPFIIVIKALKIIFNVYTYIVAKKYDGVIKF